MAILVLIAAVTSAARADSGDARRDVVVAQATQTEPASPAAADAPAIPAIKPPSPTRKRGSGPRNENADCAWSGKRTVQLLARDDLIAADGFFKFYKAFGCPVPHLGDAFGCTVDGLGDADARQLEGRVAACWADPSKAPQPDAVAAPDNATPAPDAPK